MISAPLPENEPDRLRALRQLHVLDTPPEAAFDELVEAAAEIFAAPIALVTLIDADRQWFKARIGLDVTETPRAISFCAHAVASGEALIVGDARRDPRFQDNPLVCGGLGIRFYAGVPLIDDGGCALGTICVVDQKPRTLIPQQLRLLEVLARQAVRQLSLREQAHQIARERDTHRAIREEHDRFFALSLDLLCTTTAEGCFVRLNPAWSRTLGHPEAVLRGRPLLDFTHPEDQPAVQAAIERLRGGQDAVTFESRFHHRDGSWRWLMWSIVASKETRHLYAVARDTTEQKRLEAAREAFVSTVSHELRTPLTSIQGSLGLVAGGVVGAVSEPVGELIQIAQRNTDRLVRMISDLLDFEKISTGHSGICPRPVAATELLQTALQANQGLAHQHGVTLEMQALDALVLADPDALSRVLDNLISNAIKHSSKGSTVRLSARRCAGGVEFAVQDEGTGIPASFQDRVFQRFSQADTEPHRAGTGLGLTITRALVEEHGGSIWFESEEGVGTAFFFTLPSSPLPIKPDRGA